MSYIIRRVSWTSRKRGCSVIQSIARELPLESVEGDFRAGRSNGRAPLEMKDAADLKEGVLGGGLFVSLADDPAGCRIDQMNLRAGQAGYGFIGLGTVIGRFVGDPALHLQAGIGAAVEERCHLGPTAFQRLSGQDRSRIRCLGHSMACAFDPYQFHPRGA
jgi:hypothetical protein